MEQAGNGHGNASPRDRWQVRNGEKMLPMEMGSRQGILPVETRNGQGTGETLPQETGSAGTDRSTMGTQRGTRL